MTVSSTPTFSVVIPCHNAEKTLPETLASLQAQSLTDWECILVNDGSVDSTREILTAAMLDDERFIVIHQPQSGPSVARNTGIAQAQGRYVAFLDSDDLWHPDSLAWHLAYTRRHPDVSVSYGQVAFFRQDPDQPGTFSTVPRKDLRVPDLLCENPVCTTSNLVVRRDVFAHIGAFAEDMKHGEDRHWLIRAAAAGYRIRGIDRALCWYRMTPGGLSTDLESMHRGWQISLDTAVSLGAAPDAAELRRAQAVYHRYLARRALRTGAPGMVAARYALRGFTAAPFAFLEQIRRGGPTLLGSLAAPVMPMKLRRAVFSD